MHPDALRKAVKAFVKAYGIEPDGNTMIAAFNTLRRGAPGIPTGSLEGCIYFRYQVMAYTVGHLLSREYTTRWKTLYRKIEIYGI